jgi:hypothetical protein
MRIAAERSLERFAVEHKAAVEPSAQAKHHETIFQFCQHNACKLRIFSLSLMEVDVSRLLIIIEP